MKRERLIEIMNEQYDGDCETFNAEVAANLILDEIEKSKAPDKAGEREGLDRWHPGSPPKPWSEEWFIAKTVFGDKVVLIALPDEYSYDFKTADETHIMRDCIAAWMQFPESEYVSFGSHQPNGAEASRGVGAVPAGWKLVPEKPTPEMLKAGYGEHWSWSSGRAYRAMLAATPTPPTPDSTGSAGDEYRVGRKVRRNVYRGDQPVFVASTESEAVWLVALLNAGQAALTPSAPIAVPVREPTEEMLLAFYRAAWPKADGRALYIPAHKLADLRRGWAAATGIAAPVRDDGARELVEALKPFVKHYDPRWMDDWEDHLECSTFARVTFGDLRRARNLILASLTAPAGGVPGEAQTKLST